MFVEILIARTRVEVSVEEVGMVQRTCVEEVGMVQRTWARQKQKSTELGVESRKK